MITTTKHMLNCGMIVVCCPVGEQLRQDMVEACEQGRERMINGVPANASVVRQTMYDYFTHINGVPQKFSIGKRGCLACHYE